MLLDAPLGSCNKSGSKSCSRSACGHEGENRLSANSANVGIRFRSRIPTSPFARDALCAASICSAVRLFVCFVLSRINRAFQVNLYHHTFHACRQTSHLFLVLIDFDAIRENAIHHNTMPAAPRRASKHPHRSIASRSYQNPVLRPVKPPYARLPLLRQGRTRTACGPHSGPLVRVYASVRREASRRLRLVILRHSANSWRIKTRVASDAIKSGSATETRVNPYF